MNHVTDDALMRLDDYVRGVGSDAEHEAYEEDLFTRALADDTPELAFRARLEQGLRELRDRGTIELWLTRAQVDELEQLDLEVVYHVFHASEPEMPTIPDDADLVVTKIPVDLTGVTRLEAEVLTADGKVLKRMPDIHFDAEEGAVYACCEAGLARTAASVQRMTRLWSVGEGERRLVLEAPAVQF